jgi:hypothetical protein
MDGGRPSSASSLLFDPSELALRPTGAARLRAIARRPPRAATARETRREEDRRTIGRLAAWGETLARSFGLRYAVIEAERDGVHGHYGICYEDGVIRIRLRHATTGRLLKESSLVDTLCHELAHLRQMDHGPRFRQLYGRILDRARREGYYRPGTDGAARPLQGELFGAEACGAVPRRS